MTETVRPLQVDHAAGLDRAVTQRYPHRHQAVGTRIEVVEVDVGAGRGGRPTVEMPDDTPRQQKRGGLQQCLGQAQQSRILYEPGESRRTDEAVGRMTRPAVRWKVRRQLPGENTVDRVGPGPQVDRVEPGEVVGP